MSPLPHEIITRIIEYAGMCKKCIMSPLDSTFVSCKGCKIRVCNGCQERCQMCLRAYCKMCPAGRLSLCHKCKALCCKDCYVKCKTNKTSPYSTTQIVDEQDAEICSLCQYETIFQSHGHRMRCC